MCSIFESIIHTDLTRLEIINLWGYRPWRRRLWRRSQNLLPEQVSDFPNFFLEFLFPNSVLMYLFPGLWVESPTAIFSQPTFLANIWTALSEKEIWKEKPPRLKCSKMTKIWKEKFAEMTSVHFTRLLGLLEHYLKRILRIRILRRVRIIERTFSSSNFDPATGVTLVAGLNLFRSKVSIPQNSLRNSQILELYQVMSR